MRPPQRYRLTLQTTPQSKERAERFQEALREFIEALVRSQIAALRNRATVTNQVSEPLPPEKVASDSP